MKFFDPAGKGKGGGCACTGWGWGATQKELTEPPVKLWFVLSGSKAPTDSPSLALLSQNPEVHCELKTVI